MTYHCPHHTATIAWQQTIPRWHTAISIFQTKQEETPQGKSLRSSMRTDQSIQHTSPLTSSWWWVSVISTTESRLFSDSTLVVVLTTPRLISSSFVMTDVKLAPLCPLLTVACSTSTTEEIRCMSLDMVCISAPISVTFTYTENSSISMMSNNCIHQRLQCRSWMLLITHSYWYQHLQLFVDGSVTWPCKWGVYTILYAAFPLQQGIAWM